MRERLETAKQTTMFRKGACKSKCHKVPWHSLLSCLFRKVPILPKEAGDGSWHLTKDPGQNEAGNERIANPCKQPILIAGIYCMSQCRPPPTLSSEVTWCHACFATSTQSKEALPSQQATQQYCALSSLSVVTTRSTQEVVRAAQTPARPLSELTHLVHIPVAELAHCETLQLRYEPIVRWRSCRTARCHVHNPSGASERAPVILTWPTIQIFVAEHNDTSQ